MRMYTLFAHFCFHDLFAGNRECDSLIQTDTFH